MLNQVVSKALTRPARGGLVLAGLIALYLLNHVIGVAALACGFAYVIWNRMGHVTPEPDHASE